MDEPLILLPIDLADGGCDGPMPLWQLLSIEGPANTLQGIGHIGHLVPWLPNRLQPVGARWVFPEFSDPRRVHSRRLSPGWVPEMNPAWKSVQLFDKYPLVMRRCHVLYIKGTSVSAFFWRIDP